MALPATPFTPAGGSGRAEAPLLQWAPGQGGAAPGVVTHVFTHFRLTMTVMKSSLDPGCVLPPDAQWWPVTRLAEAGLPTLFAKAAAVAIRERE